MYSTKFEHNPFALGILQTCLRAYKASKSILLIFSSFQSKYLPNKQKIGKGNFRRFQSTSLPVSSDMVIQGNFKRSQSNRKVYLIILNACIVFKRSRLILDCVHGLLRALQKTKSICFISLKFVVLTDILAILPQDSISNHETR